MTLLPHHEFFSPKFPKIPEALIAQCLGFFSYVEKKHDWECGLVLLYNPDTYQYAWCCPDQECANYDLKFTTPVPGKDYEEQWVHFGDIHLHPGMSAYHSGTDQGDEMTASDGLHLVYGTPKHSGSNGHWDKKSNKWVYDDEGEKRPGEFCGVFVTEGARFKVEPSAVLESLTVAPSNFPKAWYMKCKAAPKKNWLTGVGYGD